MTLTKLWLVLPLLAPGSAYAGHVYGTLVSDGRAVKHTDIAIQCGENAPVTGSTAADGAYRINVPEQGQCMLTLPSYDGRPSGVVFSGPNPALYNFELVKLANGKYELRRR